MNTERAILKSKLSALKIRKMDLETKAASNIADVKTLLAAASIRPLSEIDVEAAAVLLKEAAALKQELAGVVADIARINGELE